MLKQTGKKKKKRKERKETREKKAGVCWGWAKGSSLGIELKLSNGMEWNNMVWGMLGEERRNSLWIMSVKLELESKFWGLHLNHNKRLQTTCLQSSKKSERISTKG